MRRSASRALLWRPAVRDSRLGQAEKARSNSRQVRKGVLSPKEAKVRSIFGPEMGRTMHALETICQHPQTATDMSVYSSHHCPFCLLVVLSRRGCPSSPRRASSLSALRTTVRAPVRAAVGLAVRAIVRAVVRSVVGPVVRSAVRLVICAVVRSGLRCAPASAFAFFFFWFFFLTLPPAWHPSLLVILSCVCLSQVVCYHVLLTPPSSSDVVVPSAQLISEVVDVDYLRVRVQVEQLPFWAASWSLGPSHSLKSDDLAGGLAPLTFAPFTLLLPLERKALLIGALQAAGVGVMPGPGLSIVGNRSCIWVDKVMSALLFAELRTVYLLGFGYKQPLLPFLDRVRLVPRVYTIHFGSSPGTSVDIHQEENTYDIGLTYKTPGKILVVHAQGLPATSVHRPQLDDPRSPLHALHRLDVERYPMFSDLCNGFGTLFISPKYDRRKWQPLADVRGP